jgi:hypothetical protein
MATCLSGSARSSPLADAHAIIHPRPWNCLHESVVVRNRISARQSTCLRRDGTGGHQPWRFSCTAATGMRGGWYPLAALAAAAVLTGCGSTATSPSAPSTVATSPPAPTATGTLQGTVTYYRSPTPPWYDVLPLARVEVISGTATGTFALTNDLGLYEVELPVGPVIVKITKEPGCGSTIVWTTIQPATRTIEDFRFSCNPGFHPASAPILKTSETTALHQIGR